MPKKLVLCSDGTGNSSAKSEKTNVWRLFQAIDQTLPDQLAKYDDGVGTSSIKLLAILGGAFGYGLKRNVIDLYEFVCRNYQPGDDIHGFGFSRGAFTIRVLAALIDSQGLVEGRSEEELHARAVVAYRRYRNERYPSWSPLVWLGRRLRDAVLWLSTRSAREHLHNLPAHRRPGQVPIRFLGLWDTVAAYGMPVDELKWGISLLIWPMAAVDHHLGLRVRRACHALSLDDPRQTFHPILFDETHESRLVKDGKVAPDRLTQVWFAGAHSNVGGGYPEDQQSLVTLDWMMSQARDAGLRLDDSAVRTAEQGKSAFARLYDPRRGLAAYYRYAPRDVDMGEDADRQPIRAIVHGSVVMRMAEGSDAYAPITLPAHFDVLAPDGSLIPMAGFEDAALRTRLQRPMSTTAPADVAAARTAALRAAIAAIGTPQVELVEQVRDTVWWRRVAYFVCLAFTLLLVAFPLAAPIYAHGLNATLTWLDADLARDAHVASDWLDGTLTGVIAPWVGPAESVAPSWSALWLDALARQPFEMIVALALVALPFFAGSFLAQRVHDRAWFAWHPARRGGYIDWVRTSARRSLVLAGALLALAVALLVAASLCRWPAEISGLLRLLALLFVLALAWRVAIVLHLRQIRDGRIPITATLFVARKLRGNALVDLVVTAVAHVVVPLAFALALLWGMVGVASHFVMRSADSAGTFCTPTLAGTAPRPFELKSMCWASGLQVKKDHRYEVTLDATGVDWRDRSIAASVAGIDKLTAAHFIATPIKRNWSADWFVPLLRIGAIGNDERVIPADGPAAARPGAAHLTFVADRDGELFMYVDDAVGMGPWTHLFYDNNNHGATPPAGGADATLRVRDVTGVCNCCCCASAAAFAGSGTAGEAGCRPDMPPPSAASAGS